MYQRPASPLTRWHLPSRYKRVPETLTARKRERKGIIAVGMRLPPMIKSFKKIGVPRNFRSKLRAINLRKLNPL